MKTRRRLVLVLATIGVLAVAPCWVMAQTDQGETETPELREVPSEQVPAQPEGAPEGAPTGEGQAPPAGGSDRQPQGLFGNKFFLPVMIGAIVLMYVWTGRSRRKRESERKQMLSNLKKGDKVTSIGGIVGTVIEVREDEVTVKVDETNNVRMKFARWAIRGVGDTAKTETPER